MELPFWKYQGTGNDFVIIDNRDGQCQLSQQQVAFLCHRRFGIGADGLMLLASHPDYDFEMVYFNADGRESSMCGNGGRCLVKFAFDRGLHREHYHFLAIDGPHQARLNSDGTVSLKMVDVESISSESGDFVLNTGSPHYIHYVDDLDAVNVVTEGRAVRNSDRFQADGINVNFVKRGSTPNQIAVRTYERGVEDETLSCGTGVTAAALVSAPVRDGASRIDVATPGGQLAVKFNRQGQSFTNVWLIGPATHVFEGTIRL